ncbi:MAG: arabinose 5-phosphate isomerase [Capsulimonas sp.]|jgi:arabinose-5-phosphate isomerase|nr:arabinose 5-phosphate isomerase [Capsulimonas sp.]
MWLGEGRRVLEEEARALQSLAARMDSGIWMSAVTLLLEAKGRVVVTGMGKSGAVGRKIAGTLASTGTPALFLHPAEAVHGDLGMLAPADVVIALSYSGETDEIRAILPTINRLQVPILALTSNKRSTLAQSSAVVIDVGIGQEACPMNLAPTTSTTAMIAMGDALALTVMGARGFDASDYAKLHPAGSLGRRLTLRVADVMRTGDNLAIVSQDAVMFDAVFAITKAHAGAAIVVDSEGRLTGLVTDGDIRRHLLDGQDLLQRSVFSVMNRAPGTVSSDILAIEGLQRLDDFHPDPGSKAGEAPVVDTNGRPVGMLMLKDLVKAGIVLE